MGIRFSLFRFIFLYLFVFSLAFVDSETARYYRRQYLFVQYIVFPLNKHFDSQEKAAYP